MIRALWLVALLPFALCVGRASAHSRSVSYSVWRLEGSSLHVWLKFSALDRTALASSLAGSGVEPTDPALLGLIAAKLKVFADRRPLRVLPESMRFESSSGAWTELAWDMACPAPPHELELRSDLLLDTIAAHVHFVKILDSAGFERRSLLTASERSFSVSFEESPILSKFDLLESMFFVGFHLALAAWELLAFLACLALGSSSARELAGAALGFGCGQLLALSLALSGLLIPQATSVEPALGLGVAVAAVTSAWLAEGRRGVLLPRALGLGLGCISMLAGFLGRPGSLALGGLACFSACGLELCRRRSRPTAPLLALLCAFGLNQGFALACVPRLASAPPSTQAWCAAGFCLGLALGQALPLCFGWLALDACAPPGSARRLRLIRAGSAFALALGVYWLVSRGLGPT